MNMNPNTSDFFERTVNNGTTVLLHWCRESNGYEWEVYYKRPEYPYVYAFGIPACSPASAFDVALRNVDEYNYLFEEDDTNG